MSVLLALVTNDPLEASMHLLGCPPDWLPGWIKVFSDSDRIRAIPDGAKIYAYFVKGSRQQLAQEIALDIRRERGRCQFGLTAEVSEKLLKLKRERRARDDAAAQVQMENREQAL